MTNIVFVSQFLAQWCAHDGTSDAGGSTVMCLARLSPRGVKS